MRDQLSKAWHRHPGLIIGAGLALIIAGGLASVALTTPALLSLGGPASPAGSRGPSLDIAVVAPVEPEILPGSTMDVGVLVDGFDKEALKTSSNRPEFEDYEGVYPGPADDLYARNEQKPTNPRSQSNGGSDPQHWATVQGRGDRLGLGFDGPRPETRSEREARLRASVPVQRRPEFSQPPVERDATFY